MAIVRPTIIVMQKSVSDCLAKERDHPDGDGLPVRERVVGGKLQRVADGVRRSLVAVRYADACVWTHARALGRAFTTSLA